jgi:hypothetical protein
MSIQSNVAEEATLLLPYMKALKMIVSFIFIAGIVTIGVMYSNKALGFVGNVSKVEMYEKHLKPVPGAYYSCESSSKEGANTFIIGYLVRPQVGGKVVKKGEMVTIQVPLAKGTGLVKGSFLTVSEVRGVPTTQYFNDENSVVQHALDN